MEVLVLSWGFDPTPGQVPAGAFAAALARRGHSVRVVTRQGLDGVLPQLDGVEVHAVGDAPPIVPSSLGSPDLHALAFAARATSVAVRRLEERPVDVVHAVGWAAGPVVAALRQSHGITVAAELRAASLQDDGTVGELARQLAEDADVVVATTAHVAAAVPARTTVRLRPIGASPPRRRPGPPPARGPVHLVAPPGMAWHSAARQLRSAQAESCRLTAGWRRRPIAAVILDAADVETVARAFEAGVPILVAAGPAADVVRDADAGVVIGPSVAAAAQALDALVRDSERRTALGAASATAAADHAWDRVVDVWEDAVDGLQRPALHAAG